ncbi:hypothetical protein AAE478_007640 [Parahypoxylon ruwenzoriense]
MNVVAARIRFFDASCWKNGPNREIPYLSTPKTGRWMAPAELTYLGLYFIHGLVLAGRTCRLTPSLSTCFIQDHLMFYFESASRKLSYDFWVFDMTIVPRSKLVK